MHSNLGRPVAAGQVVKPWLMLGPFYEDVSGQVQGLTCFERPGATVGKTVLADAIAEATALLAAAPREGQEARFRGQVARWHLERRPEQYLAWGTYNIANHLVAALLATLVTPGEPGRRRLRLHAETTLYAFVAVNGRILCSTDAMPGTHEFEAVLEPGENLVQVGLFRVGRMARVGFRLEIDGEVMARVPLGQGLLPEARSRVEDQVGALRLARDIFYPEHEVGLHLGVAPTAEAPLEVQLLAEDGEALRTLTPTAAGAVTLCRGQDLADGRYHILCRWRDASGAPLTSVAFDIHKLTPVAPLVGYEHLPERKQRVLEHYAASGLHEARPDIWGQVARYALGRYDQVDEAVVRDTCDFVAARKDCADFVIQGLLRLMYWERKGPQLSREINALMKDTVLCFKYWVDEPGDTVMYMDSENHRLLFHVAEWMAGQLFPTEEFTNSRERGLFHAMKGRMYITEWLRQRGRFGFDEWHSNSYYPVCVAPLANVYDFATYEDGKLQQMAGAVLDYMFFNLAADSYQGIFGTTHGRSYGINLKYPDLEGTSATCWLLYGLGSLSSGTSGMAPVSIATSSYVLPPILSKMAADRTSVIEARVRQGILRGAVRHADFCVYRTPDYMLSGLQDHRKGEYEPSSHVAQVTLGNKATIFWSCPQACGEGSGLRPDYWSGHAALPRVIQYRNVMSLTFRLGRYAWMSHCFFEPARLDEVQFAGKWAFARVGQGYVGIYSQNGMAVGDYGQYAGRELVCEAPENTWLVECGRQADWGSFAAFVQALTSAAVEVDGGAVSYASPSIGRFVTGWDVTPTVEGRPIALHGYPLVDSPWARASFGSGELTLRYGDETYEVWFNQ